MPSIRGEFELQNLMIRGGMDTQREQYESLPLHAIDLLNVVPRPDGYVGGPGWSIVGNEIVSATHGIVNHVTGFAKADEGNFTMCVTATRTMENTAGVWTNRQGATALTLGANAHATSVWYNDELFFGYPASGAANAPKKFTTSGSNVAAIAAAMFNAGDVEIFGNRLVSARVWNASDVYLPYDVYRSADGAPGTHNAEFYRASQSPSVIMRIMRLGQQLMIYKQHSIDLLHISGGEQVDVQPYEPDELPGNVGLALHDAVVAGGAYHFFLGNEDIYLIRAGELPQPIGGPVIQIIRDALAAGSFVLAGYDNRSSQNEGFYLLTNVATAANLKTIGPNAPALTYMYLFFDLATKTWSRGELTNIPRAAGNYYTRFGFLDAAPISQTAMLMGLDSTNGSTVYDLDFTVTTRAGAAFTPRIITTIADFGDGFLYKQWADIWPIFKRRSSGTCTISVKAANTPGEVPAEVRSLTFAMDGTQSPRQINYSARFLQLDITFNTNDFYFQGVALKSKERR